MFLKTFCATGLMENPRLRVRVLCSSQSSHLSSSLSNSNSSPKFQRSQVASQSARLWYITAFRHFTIGFKNATSHIPNLNRVKIYQFISGRCFPPAFNQVILWKVTRFWNVLWVKWLDLWGEDGLWKWPPYSSRVNNAIPSGLLWDFHLAIGRINNPTHFDRSIAVIHTPFWPFRQQIHCNL